MGAAKQAFAALLAGRMLTGNQIELVDTVVDEVTENGVMAAERLYQSPYTNVIAAGVENLLTV